MRSFAMRWGGVVFVLLALTLVLAPAAAPAGIDAARTRLAGVWDATPGLDLDFLEATAKDQLPFLRANALGTRVSYRFKSDGTFTSIVFKRSGREDGVNVDRLVSTRRAGQWVIVGVNGQDVKLRLTPEGAKPVDRSIKFTSDDGFDMDPPELGARMFQTPMRDAVLSAQTCGWPGIWKAASAASWWRLDKPPLAGDRDSRAPDGVTTPNTRPRPERAISLTRSKVETALSL